MMEDVSVDDTISLILKLVGETCNLDCVYCYEKRKPYQGSRILKLSTIEDALQAFSGRSLRIELHGGEPLLYPRTKMQQLVALLTDRTEPTSVAIQTNGTLLSKEWLDIFSPLGEAFEVGISLDGPEAINDWRLFISGKSSMSSVVRGLRLLENNNIPVGIISVVNSLSLHRAEELLQFFSGFGNLRLLKFVPCFDFNVQQEKGPARAAHTLAAFNADGRAQQQWAINPEQYAQFLNDAFDFWCASGLTEKYILEPFLALTQSTLGVRTNSCIFSDTKCHHVLTLYPDGTIGSCDEFNRNDVKYGDVAEIRSQLNSPSELFRKTHVNSSVEVLLEKCAQCSHFAVCKGGCLASRTRLLRVGREEEYCSYRKIVIDHVGNVLRGLA